MKTYGNKMKTYGIGIVSNYASLPCNRGYII
jgi:hypothetical protein